MPGYCMTSKKINFRAINQSIYDHFDRIIEIFGLDVVPANNGEYVGVCIHPDADNRTAFRVYPNGGWVCFTRGCHDGQNSLIHLLKLLIEKKFNTEVNIPYAIEWYLDNVLGGVDVLDLPKNLKTTAKYKYTPIITILATRSRHLLPQTIIMVSGLTLT